MTPPAAQNLLCARNGDSRVTIGLDTPEALRRLSDARKLTCPGCGEPVILHAGAIRAHHFAHLPGTVCRSPQSEPETEEHRAGKLLIARWLLDRIPGAEVAIEAPIAETGQRADVLVIALDDDSARRIAIEFQCANLSAREWRRRHRAYRDAGIADLWLLGGSRLVRAPSGTGRKSNGASPSVFLRTSELERALISDGAPLLFLEAIGASLAVGALVRFRPVAETQALQPEGRLSTRPLLDLAFPWRLLDWPGEVRGDAAASENPRRPASFPSRESQKSDWWLREWLSARYHVSPERLPAFFGVEVKDATALACPPSIWQAAVYYRFIHGRVGDGWWLSAVETWVRTFVPLASPENPRKLHAALTGYQELLAAAGLLSLPMGYGRVNARIAADLTTLPAPPDAETVLRLARYRRTITREVPSDEYRA